MNLDLAHQLLLRSLLHQRLFLDDLSCRESLAVLITGELIASSEASLAEEAAFSVALDTYVTIEAHYFLLNDIDFLVVIHATFYSINL